MSFSLGLMSSKIQMTLRTITPIIKLEMNSHFILFKNVKSFKYIDVVAKCCMRETVLNICNHDRII